MGGSSTDLKMRYVAAYMLAALGSKGAEPSAADVEKILGSVGIEAEADKVKKVCSELAGKNLASVPSGVGVLLPLPRLLAVPRLLRRPRRKRRRRSLKSLTTTWASVSSTKTFCF